MTPITLSDGLTLVLEHVAEISALSDEYAGRPRAWVTMDYYGATTEESYGQFQVAESDAALIRSALFEAQRREIAVKIFAAFAARPDFVDSEEELQNVFRMADAILAAEKKGAEQ